MKNQSVEENSKSHIACDINFEHLYFSILSSHAMEGGFEGAEQIWVEWAKLFPTHVFTDPLPTFDFLLFVIGQWTRTRIGRKSIEFMAVSNGQGLATGPILWGDVGQIFKLGINGHTNTQIRCTQILPVQRLRKIESDNSSIQTARYMQRAVSDVQHSNESSKRIKEGMPDI